MSWETKQMTPTSVGTIYSYVEVRDWETNATHSTYRHNGGASSDFYWNGATVRAQLKWWEDGVWHDSTVSGSYGEEQYYAPGGYTTYCTPVDVTDSFIRKEYDRTVWLGCDSSVTNQIGTASALSEIGPYVVPHLAGKPSNLTAEWSGGDIVLTWENPSTSYHILNMLVSVDGGDFSTFWSYDRREVGGYLGTCTYEGADMGSSYEFKCHVVYYGSVGADSNVASAPLLAPASPTLVSPSTQNVVLDGNDVTFSWLHNSRSGMPQEAYELEWDANDSGVADTIAGGAESSITLAIGEGYGPGDTIKWRVRTKDNGWGEWSAWRAFTIVSVPVVTVMSPSGDVASMPIAVTADFSDYSTCADASFALMLDGAQVLAKPMSVSGRTLTGSIEASDIILANHGDYTVVVTARSGLNMTASGQSSFSTAFKEPVPGTLTISNDPETGYVSLTASFDNQGADEPAVSVSVLRVNDDGTLTALISEGESGATAIDRYAPLNKPYRYAAVTHSALGAVSTVYVQNAIASDVWFVYWGENIARAKWNPSNSGIGLTRPQRRYVDYPGRKDPVSYDGSSVRLSERPSFMFIGQDEVEPFVKLIEDGGHGVYKSCDGWVYNADFDLTLNPEYTATGFYGGISLSITRTAGRKL